MAFGIVAAVNVEPGPDQIDVAFVGRTRGIVNDYAWLVFNRRDGVDVIDRGNRVTPGQSAIIRSLDKDAAFGTRRLGDANSGKGKMRMVSRAIAAKVNRIVALRQILRIRDRSCSPRFAAIHRDIVITARTWPRRQTGLEGRGHNVVGILRINRYRNFSRIGCVDLADSYHLLSES